MPRPNPARSLVGEEALRSRIAWERLKRKWSTQGLAKRVTEAGCPINQTAIWKIENGKPPRRITYDEALAFARVFEIPLEELAIRPEIYANTELRKLMDLLQEQVAVLHRTKAEARVTMQEIRHTLATLNTEALIAYFDDSIAEEAERRMAGGEGPMLDMDIDLEKLKQRVHEADAAQIVNVAAIILENRSGLLEFEGQFDDEGMGLESDGEHPEAP